MNDEPSEPHAEPRPELEPGPASDADSPAATLDVDGDSAVTVSDQELARLSELGQRIGAEVGRVVVGMEREVRHSLEALLVGGHVLLEGPPGVAKTLFVRTLAAAVGGDYGRVQFTPDLMPADVIGTGIFRPNEGVFRFQPGPIFVQFLLCDEINRAPAKTQSALLEAMQERALTVDGVRHELPRPFTVFGTMNPVEHEGTYPLPEAQLDRFLYKVLIRYPEAELESELLLRAHGRPLDASPGDLGVQAVTNASELLSLRDIVRRVAVRADLADYTVRLLRATREHAALSLGASPRAGVMLLWAAKAHAALEGRGFCLPDDIKAVLRPALRHRVILDPAEEIEGTHVDEVLVRVLDSVEVPR